MDNNNINNTEPRPRKKVTKETIRNRQLAGVAVISFIVLVFFIIIARSCSSISANKEAEKAAKNTTTTTTEATTTEIPTTTVPETTTSPLNNDVIIDKKEVHVEVGGSDMPIISGYPAGVYEVNEVWKSEDSSIATVNSWGSITGVADGETNIILTFDNCPEVEIKIKVTVGKGASGGPVVGGGNGGVVLGGEDESSAVAPIF